MNLNETPKFNFLWQTHVTTNCHCIQIISLAVCFACLLLLLSPTYITEPKTCLATQVCNHLTHLKYQLPADAHNLCATSNSCDQTCHNYYAFQSSNPYIEHIYIILCHMATGLRYQVPLMFFAEALRAPRAEGSRCQDQKREWVHLVLFGGMVITYSMFKAFGMLRRILGVLTHCRFCSSHALSWFRSF